MINKLINRDGTFLCRLESSPKLCNVLTCIHLITHISLSLNSCSILSNSSILSLMFSLASTCSPKLSYHQIHFQFINFFNFVFDVFTFIYLPFIFSYHKFIDHFNFSIFSISSLMSHPAKRLLQLWLHRFFRKFLSPVDLLQVRQEHCIPGMVSSDKASCEHEVHCNVLMT